MGTLAEKITYTKEALDDLAEELSSYSDQRIANTLYTKNLDSYNLLYSKSYIDSSNMPTPYKSLEDAVLDSDNNEITSTGNFLLTSDLLNTIFTKVISEKETDISDYVFSTDGTTKTYENNFFTETHKKYIYISYRLNSGYNYKLKDILTSFSSYPTYSFCSATTYYKITQGSTTSTINANVDYKIKVSESQKLIMDYKNGILTVPLEISYNFKNLYPFIDTTQTISNITYVKSILSTTISDINIPTTFTLVFNSNSILNDFYNNTISDTNSLFYYIYANWNYLPNTAIDSFLTDIATGLNICPNYTKDYSVKPLKEWKNFSSDINLLESDISEDDIMDGKVIYDIKNKKYLRGNKKYIRPVSKLYSRKKIGRSSFIDTTDNKYLYGLGTGSEVIADTSAPENYLCRINSSSSSGEFYITPIAHVFQCQWYIYFSHFNTTAYCGFYCVPDDTSIAPTTASASMATVVADQYLNIKALVPLSQSQFLLLFSWNINAYTESVTYERLITLRPNRTWFYGANTNNPANLPTGSVIIEPGHAAAWYDIVHSIIPLQDNDKNIIEWATVEFRRVYSSANIETERRIYWDEMFVASTGSAYTNNSTAWTTVSSCVPSTDYGVIDLKFCGKYGIVYTSQTTSANFINRSYLRQCGRLLTARNGNYNVGTYNNYILGSLNNGKIVTLDFGLTRFGALKTGTKYGFDKDLTEMTYTGISKGQDAFYCTSPVNIQIFDYDYVAGSFTLDQTLSLGKTLVKTIDSTNYVPEEVREINGCIGYSQTTTSFTNKTNGTGCGSGIKPSDVKYLAKYDSSDDSEEEEQETDQLYGTTVISTGIKAIQNVPFIQYPENVLYLDNNVFIVRFGVIYNNLDGSLVDNSNEFYRMYQIVKDNEDNYSLEIIADNIAISDNIVREKIVQGNQAITTGILTTTILQQEIDDRFFTQADIDNDIEAEYKDEFKELHIPSSGLCGKNYIEVMGV